MEPIAWRALVAAGFILAQATLLYTYYDTQRETKQIEMVRLSRDLSSEFYGREPIYRDMRNAIEACEKLYKSWGGRFDHDQINRYLGFFEDVGYYYKRGFIDIDMIAHSFGAYIIEAWEYPEVQKYVNSLRTNAKQPNSFRELEAVAGDLQKQEQFATLARDAKSLCDKPASNPVQNN